MAIREKLVDTLTDMLRPVGTAIVIAIGAVLFERVLPAPNVGGHWYCLTRTDDALDGDQYKGMFLLYDTFLRVDGEAITGNDEKFAEYSSCEKGPYPWNRRIFSTSSGTVHRRYFADSHVSIGMDEQGVPRKSTRSYDMVVSDDRMAGTFHSTVANQTGHVLCKRATFDLTGETAAIKKRLASEINRGN